MPTTQWISSNHEITFAPRHGLSKQARPYVAMMEWWNARLDLIIIRSKRAFHHYNVAYARQQNPSHFADSQPILFQLFMQEK